MISYYNGIHIGNLHKNVTEEYLYSFLEKAGFKDINKLKIPRDFYTRESKGYAFVEFYD